MDKEIGYSDLFTVAEQFVLIKKMVYFLGIFFLKDYESNYLY